MIKIIEHNPLEKYSQRAHKTTLRQNNSKIIVYGRKSVYCNQPLKNNYKIRFYLFHAKLLCFISCTIPFYAFYVFLVEGTL